MERLTPQAVIEPEVIDGADEASINMHPLARGIIGVAVNLAIDLGREVLAPELAPQQRQPALNQQELLRNVEELLYLQSEADLLKAQSGGRIMGSFFGTPAEIRADIEKMNAARAELAEIAATPPQAPAVELQYTLQTVSIMDAGNV